jgi:hypothetical protein
MHARALYILPIMFAPFLAFGPAVYRPCPELMVGCAAAYLVLRLLALWVVSRLEQSVA